jgi:cell fate (sporulation/competence/biofilm development) regulator YlbF (YheA/YmcA/DUF963 family)
MAGTTEEEELVVKPGDDEEQETETGTELNDEDGEGDEELVVQIGEEESPPQEREEAPQWVKDLRKSHREVLRENRELKARVGAPAAPQKPALPDRPKLDQFDYDEDKFQAAMDSWYVKKSEIDNFETSQRTAQQEAQKQVEATRTAYQEKAKALKVSDFKEAEEEVINTLSEVQQGLILQGADSSHLLVYALGKNPKRLAELAAIKDPVKFAFAAAKLEKDLKTSNRKSEKPAPETPLKNSGAAVVGSSKTLDRLREEAAKTGDMSKVVAFKRQMRKS